MADYGDPERVRSLSKIHPEVEEALKSQPPDELDWADPANLPRLREIVNEGAMAVQQTEEQAKLESAIEIPMRDGHHNEIRIHKPANPTGKSPVIVLIHGGGFSVGNNRILIPTARALADLLGATVITISYRLTPENPFPLSVNDCWDSLVWISKNAHQFGADPAAGFIIGGVSAGGQLTAVIGQKAITDKLPPPVTGLWLVVPSILTEEIVPPKYKHLFISREQNSKAPSLETRELDAIRQLLSPDVKSPLYSPVNAPNAHVGMPPTYIQVCGLDPTRDDGLIYEALLRENGVSTRLDVYPGTPHAYWFDMGHLKSAQECRADSLRGVAWLLGKEASADGLERAMSLL